MCPRGTVSRYIRRTHWQSKWQPVQDEMTHVTEVLRRLKALLLMGQSLDANYRAAAASALSFDQPA